MSFSRKCTVAVYSKKEFLFYQELGVRSFLIRTTTLSRMGKLSFSKAKELIELSIKFDSKLIIEWDILMEQLRFEQTTAQLEEWLLELGDLSKEVSFRVQDLGAMSWIKKNYPKIKIQLNLETGHRNLPSIKKYIKFLGGQLERVILSFELSRDKLMLYRESLEVPLEILFHGRIPLFYSPRSLLSPLENSSEQNFWIEREGESEESPHKGFPIVENRHGTFMFNVKELSLVDVFDEVNSIGIDYFRVDLLRFEVNQQLEWFKKIISVVEKESSFFEFKKDYPAELIRGFYSANKSSVLFEKLKNRFLQHDDRTYIGDVIEVVKPRHIAIQIKRGPLSIGDDIFYMTPEGKRVSITLNSLRNSKGDKVTTVEGGTVAFLPYSKSLSAKSTVNKVIQSY